ncbi:Segregation and condensation protein B [Olavius algarvensis Delta 1 endosymbiont]|nr:Segregation and condensation protein B [Olavius algarvensis Delta 1 endosymbiont]
MENLKHIIESLLFVAEEPLTVDKIKRITVLAETREIRDALTALSDEYESRPGGFYLDEVAGGFQIRTRPEYNEWIRKLIRPKPLRLSKAALETLVIIAYKQPIIRSDIEHLRGVDCGGVLRVLLERKLVRVLGRREIAGRPLIYATTKHFLEVFDLKNLKDLPTPKEIEELGASLNDTGDGNLLQPIDEAAEDLAMPEGQATGQEPSAETEAEPEAAEYRESTEFSSENDSAAETTPADNIAPAEATPIIHIAAAPPAESEPAGAIPPPTEAESAPQELQKPPEDFLKK